MSVAAQAADQGKAPAQPATKRFHTTEDLAEHLGITANGVRRYARLGVIPTYRIGGRILFKLDEVEEALKQ